MCIVNIMSILCKCMYVKSYLLLELTSREVYNFLQMYIMMVGAGLGATLYGCISLYGIMSMEAAPSHLAGTSHAIVCLFANCKFSVFCVSLQYISKLLYYMNQNIFWYILIILVGGIFAGLPFSYIAKMYNWKTAFYILGCALIPTIILKILSRKFEYQFVKIKKKVQWFNSCFTHITSFTVSRIKLSKTFCSSKLWGCLVKHNSLQKWQ